jgi:hypothetical protein
MEDTEISQEEKEEYTFDEAEKISLRCSLLTMAKDILQTKASMRWQSHNQIEDVTVELIIEEADKLYKFATDIK